MVTFVFFGCNKETAPSMGTSTQFFPSELYDGPGAVWKYYVHTTQEGKQRKTNIKYRKLVFEDSKLLLKDYAADFQESYNEVISIDEDKWKIDSSNRYNYRGSLDSLRTSMIYEIGEEDVFLDWSGETSKLHQGISNDNWKNDLISLQNEVKDTVVNESNVKIFYGTLESKYQIESDAKTDTTLTIFNWRKEFTSNRGMTTQYTETEMVSYEWQLDEIMSVEEFEKRANHGTYRVAYIDPSDALDDQNEFTTCYHISRINDYYNDDRAQHLGGKGGLWEMVENNLDESLLKGQEGYLTYRFVVNCKGKAGRFVTEEADLEFNRIEFSEKLRSHFLGMLMEVPKWKNSNIYGESRDAYVYVTFKIKDDEIIEILP